MLFRSLLALVAGAKEQVLKMDCVPALIAIFLVGFGSDQVKNLDWRAQRATRKGRVSDAELRQVGAKLRALIG